MGFWEAGRTPPLNFSGSTRPPPPGFGVPCYCPDLHTSKFRVCPFEGELSLLQDLRLWRQAKGTHYARERTRGLGFFLNLCFQSFYIQLNYQLIVISKLFIRKPS